MLGLLFYTKYKLYNGYIIITLYNIQNMQRIHLSRTNGQYSKKKKKNYTICIYKNKNKDIDFPMYSTKFISMPYECI